MESAWWGMLGTFVGAAASIATTAITSRNSVLLQVAAARRESLEKHRNFQRETLLELQDAVHDEMRAATKAYLHDGREFRKTGEWGRSLLGEELNNMPPKPVGARRYCWSALPAITFAPGSRRRKRLPIKS